MKICNYIIYKFIIIFLLQTINLHAFQESVQNTEQSAETLDLVKERDNDKKYILLFCSFEQLTKYFDIESKYYSLIKTNENTFTTMLIPTNQQKIAARIPGDRNLLHFLKLINKPIISTSANISGETTCRNINEVKGVFDGKLFGALDGALGG